MDVFYAVTGVSVGACVGVGSVSSGAVGSSGGCVSSSEAGSSGVSGVSGVSGDSGASGVPCGVSCPPLSVFPLLPGFVLFPLLLGVRPPEELFCASVSSGCVVVSDSVTGAAATACVRLSV